MPATEIIFEVTEDEVDGGYSATAPGYGIHTQPKGTPLTRSAATSGKPWTVISTRACRGRG